MAVRASAHLEALDLLATLVALVTPDARVVHANASFENLLGVPRRAMLGTLLTDWVTDSLPLQETLESVAANRIATGRFETELRRPVGPAGSAMSPPELLPVHVIVNQTDRDDRVLVEMIEVEQQTRQDREERAATQAQANKELVRNLAHEIKNPLGGIRGAAQLLEMELEDKRDLIEYTQVVIKEADRLQALVDRLLRRAATPMSWTTSTSTRSASACARCSRPSIHAASNCGATTTLRSPSSAATASS
jgi:two-component system, NtrC family, nitrogen regulation sensor histidine kinase GlnL